MSLKGTSQVLVIYFVNLSPPNQASVNVELFDVNNVQLNIQPLSLGTVNIPTITGNQIQLTTDQTLYGLQLFTPKTIKLGFIRTYSPGGNDLVMQAFACTIAPQNSLLYSTLRNRVTPTRDQHALTDSGAAVPSNATTVLRLQKKLRGAASTPPQYTVTQFGLMDWRTESMTVESQPNYCTGDTSIASPSLIGKVSVDKPVEVADSTNQSRWQNASLLATSQFTLSDGIYVETLAVFFTPVTYLPFGSDETALVSTTSTFQMKSGQDVVAFSPGTTINASYWTLSTTDATVTLTYNPPATYDEASLRLLPFMELTLTSGGSPALVTQLTSSNHPMQAFSASSVAAASASQLTGPCFSFQAVKAANIVLYTDAFRNQYRFGDADAEFVLSNNGISTQLNVQLPVALRVNSLQTAPAVGTLAVEARVSATSTWYLVDDSAPNATTYSFVEYVPLAGEYEGSVGSIILLFAQNTGVGGSVSGYVSCATAGTPVSGFAATAFSASAPLLTEAEVVAQGVQWGVLQTAIDVQGFPLGSGTSPDRAISLLYKDKNMAAPAELDIGMGSSLTDVDVSKAQHATLQGGGNGVAGSSWIGHGVWMPASASPAADTPGSSSLLYDPATLLVQPMNLYNIVTGSGFTQGNAYIQWTAYPPVLTAAGATAFASTIIAATQHAQALATATAAAGLQLYNAVKTATPATLPALQAAYNQAVPDVANAQSQALIAKRASRVQTATNAVVSAQTSLDAVTALVKGLPAGVQGGALGGVVVAPQPGVYHVPTTTKLSGGDIAGLVVGGIVVLVVIALIILYSYKVTTKITSLSE
jgi:hypothetical protein